MIARVYQWGPRNYHAELDGLATGECFPTRDEANTDAIARGAKRIVSVFFDKVIGGH